MPDSEFTDIEDMLARFSQIGKMGSIGGWFALREFKGQTQRQVQFAELASQAMAARRRVLNEAVFTVTAQVEAELAIRRLAEKRAQALLPQVPVAQLPPAPPAGLPARPAPLQPPLQTYVSDQEIQDAALQAAITYASATDKEKFWADLETRLKAKQWPDATIAEVRQIATEVIRRTGG